MEGLLLDLIDLVSPILTEFDQQLDNTLPVHQRLVMAWTTLAATI